MAVLSQLFSASGNGTIAAVLTVTTTHGGDGGLSDTKNCGNASGEGCCNGGAALGVEEV